MRRRKAPERENRAVKLGTTSSVAHAEIFPFDNFSSLRSPDKLHYPVLKPLQV